jgi:hypothetical protein
LRSRPALLYVLFEHQSTVDPWMPLRILEYMLRIWRAHLAEQPKARSLPPIIPIVLHHSEHGWTAGTSFEALFDVDEAVAADLSPFLPRFRFLLDDVSRATDDELRARAVTALAKLVLGCLRHARRMPDMLGDPDRWEATLREAATARHGVHALRTVLRYMFHVSDDPDIGQLQKFFRPADKPALEEEIVTLAQHCEEKGRRIGLEQGLSQGLEQGRARQASTLLKLLHAKLGEIPPDVATRVQAADSASLERWALKLLTATTVDEVLAD